MDSKQIATGFVAGVLVAGVVAYYYYSTLAGGSTVSCAKNTDFTAGTVTVGIKFDGTKLVAEPASCTVIPGQYVKWNFPDLEELRLRFGEDYAGPTTQDRTPDENFGLLFQSSASLQKNRDLSIRMGKIGDSSDCVTYPYFLSRDGVTWDPNPAIIIKPGAATVCK